MKPTSMTITDNAQELGQAAARFCAALLNRCIAEKGAARLVLSTGASQFETLAALVQEEVDWSRVEMFHLDEYVGLAETHPASFRNYLKARFLAFAPVGRAHLIDGDPDRLEQTIAELTEAIRSAPIDLALIGIGENAHIAFNDPPADFASEAAFKVVELETACRQQQVNEGWFSGMDEVPPAALTMTVQQIMASRTIVSCVPHACKAQAIVSTLHSGVVTPDVPATKLTEHPDWHLYLDRNSAQLLDRQG